MAITASDIVSDTDVRAIVDKIRNQKYQSRRAFRDHDATEINSNSFDFPVSDDDLDGEAVEVGESSSYPRAELNWSDVSAAYTKYGVEIPISDEAVDDSAIDVVMNANEDIIRAEENRVDSVAFGVLSGNTNSNGPIDVNNNTSIEYADVVAAREQLFADEMDLGSLVLVAHALDMSDFLEMSEFTQASDLGDQVVQQGVLPGGNLTGSQAFIGTLGDVPVYLSNTGAFTEGQAFVVDTSSFGWESTRWEQDVVQYREEDQDQDVWKIRGRWDWVATNSAANIEINVT
jgi:hypothetical protein